ncbi:MAG: DNA polymerase I [Planctomycetaceae bacterium]
MRFSFWQMLGAKRMSDVLYLIDTMSLIFQVFHAIPEMTGPKGQPTNAVFGFARDILGIIRNQKPTHIICAMDSPGPGIRNDIYPEYKANRTEMPENLRPQIPLIEDVIRGLHIPLIQHGDWEADDIIATLARKAVEDGMEVRIVTNDKDARQLLGPHVQLYNCRKNTFLDEQQLLEEWGVTPQQAIDFQALVGDSSDNVPGVPLVGPKKARALLEKFGTLENVLANADLAPGKKLRENLKTFADQARMSRELVTLRTDLDLDYDWDDARLSEPDRDALFKLFTELGFGRLSEEMRTEQEKPKPERKWETIDTEQKFQTFLKELQQQAHFCLDLETTSLDAMQADIVGWAVCWQAYQGYYIPVDGPAGQPQLEPKQVLEAFRPMLEDPEIQISNQNIKYDMLVLRRAGVKLQGVGVDPMVGDYLLDAGARGHGMDKLARKYLNHETIPISDLIGSGKKQLKMFEVDIEKAAEYAAEDADIAWQLTEVISEKLRAENLWDLYWDLERPLIPVLVEMESRGIRVDVDELNRQSDELSHRLDILMGEIHALAGREFNINSPKQLSEILFDELNLPVIKKTKTGKSTNQEVLEKLATMHPLPEKIIEHRHLSKLKSTYLDALPSLVNPETGRIHTSFNQVVAATGRLSSNEPNLQNIPIRTEEGRLVRRAFIPGEPDWLLMCADYSQIELRMLAHFSGDEALAEAFREGIDIHTAVAAEIFEVDTDAVDSDMRRVAKAVNFGVIYGQSPFGLAAALGISQNQAAEFIENYFTRYAGVDSYLQQLLAEVLETGYARTICGRRRKIEGIMSTTGRQRNLAERTAINTVVQGSAADLIKKAMINLQARLEAEQHPGKMLLQIHDELVFEVPESDCDSLIEIARHEMEHAIQLDVPLVVDVKTGKNWLETEAVK